MSKKCSKCRRSVGGFFDSFNARRCTNSACGKVFCGDCCDVSGFIFKDYICPECGNETEVV